MVKQCYVLPWRRTDHDVEVLLARKVLEQERVDGQPPRITRNARNAGRARGDAVIPNNAGQWTVIGGGQKAHEREEAACQREFFEETGIDIVGPPFEAFFWSGADWCCMLIDERDFGEPIAPVIRANIAAQVPLDDELDAVRWFSVAEARQRVTTLEEVPSAYRRQAERPRDWFYEMISLLYSAAAE